MSPLFIVRSFFIQSAIVFQSWLSLAQERPSSQLIPSEEQFKVPFIWDGDSINGQWEHYAAMLIPVKLEGCPKQLYMQFDLGAPYSIFYRNKLQVINRRYPLQMQLSDSALIRQEFSFTAGKTRIHAHEMILKQLGTDQMNWEDNAVEIIGTLGTDFIGNKTLLIDYPGKTITIGYTIREKQRLIFSDFIYANRSIILPALIKGKKTLLFFDSGSSAFELLTNKETANMLAIPGATPATYPVTSWGKTLTAICYASADSIEIAAVKMPLNRVTYVEGASDAQVSRMIKMGIGGMTGNKLFLHSILLLDIKNKRFGILNGLGF